LSVQRSRKPLKWVLLALSGGIAALAQDPPGGLTLMDAVRLTLAHDPNVAIEAARVDSARGALLIASGIFDPVVVSKLSQANTKVPLTLSTQQDTRILEGTVGVSELFRTGLQLEPQVLLDRTQDVGAGTGAVDTGTVTFQIRQPLLRGRGRAAVQAGELSAQPFRSASGCCAAAAARRSRRASSPPSVRSPRPSSTCGRRWPSG
jgi:hypothetical protein